MCNGHLPSYPGLPSQLYPYGYEIKAEVGGLAGYVAWVCGLGMRLMDIPISMDQSDLWRSTGVRIGTPVVVFGVNCSLFCSRHFWVLFM